MCPLHLDSWRGPCLDPPSVSGLGPSWFPPPDPCCPSPRPPVLGGSGLRPQVPLSTNPPLLMLPQLKSPTQASLSLSLSFKPQTLLPCISVQVARGHLTPPISKAAFPLLFPSPPLPTAFCGSARTPAPSGCSGNSPMVSP